MQRRANMQASSLIILLSILTILVQFIGYYFIESVFVIWAISSIITLLCCHILQERTITFNACFNYSILTVFISLIFIVLTYGNDKSFLSYSSTMLGIAVINWLIPTLNGAFRNMFAYGVRLEDYNDFFRNTSVVFILFYSILLIYGNFAVHAFPWAYHDIAGSANFVPFQIITTQIENYYLDGSTSLGVILTYLLPRILIFLPYGFYAGLALHRRPILYKLGALIALPLIIEIVQFFMFNKRCDIDDLIYALIGGFFGALLFFITNLIFRATTGKDFLKKETGSRYLGNLLHF